MRLSFKNEFALQNWDWVLPNQGTEEWCNVLGIVNIFCHIMKCFRELYKGQSLSHHFERTINYLYCLILQPMVAYQYVTLILFNITTYGCLLVCDPYIG